MMGPVRNLAPTGERLALARLALIVMGYVVVFWLVYLVTVRTVTGRQIADAALRGAIGARPLLSGTVNTILDVVSVASLLGAMAVVAVIALVRLARLEGLAAIGIVVGSNLSTWLLKNVLLSRPDLGLDEIAPATLNSLPSGHATAAFSAVAALVFVTTGRWRDLTATVGAGYAALTGIATMLAGWHRASDSVAAFLVVGAWTGVAAAALLVVGAARADRTTLTSRWRPVEWLIRAAGVALAAAAVLSTGLVLTSPAPGNVVGSAVAFLAGALFVAGAAAGVTVAVLEVLRIAQTPQATGSAVA
jgi:membrane-associated phospholipid phosphatase